MSQSFIIITTRSMAPARLARLADEVVASQEIRLEKRFEFDCKYQITYGSARAEWFSIDSWGYREGPVIDYLYADALTDELSSLLTDTENVILYRCGFTDFTFTNLFVKAVCQLAFDCGLPLWIDNDYGTVLSCEDTVAMFAKNPAYDWRVAYQTQR